MQVFAFLASEVTSGEGKGD